VVIRYLHLLCPDLCPDEAHPILIVNPNRVLSGSILRQFLQPVVWRHFEIVQNVSRRTRGQSMKVSTWTRQAYFQWDDSSVSYAMTSS